MSAQRSSGSSGSSSGRDRSGGGGGRAAGGGMVGGQRMAPPHAPCFSWAARRSSSVGSRLVAGGTCTANSPRATASAKGASERAQAAFSTLPGCCDMSRGAPKPRAMCVHSLRSVHCDRC